MLNKILWNGSDGAVQGANRVGSGSDAGESLRRLTAWEGAAVQAKQVRRLSRMCQHADLWWRQSRTR